MRGLALLDDYAYVGDAYKWLTMLSRHLDFDVLRKKETWPAEIKRRKPDFGIVRGDHRNHYLYFAEQGIPYILLEGDVHGMIFGTSDVEREMIEKAAGIIFPCERCRDWCDENYRLPKATEIVYLRPLAEQLEFEPLPKMPGDTLAYAGGIQPKSKRQSPAGYRWYGDIFRRFIRHGWEVHLYTPPVVSDRACEEYRALGCKMHGFVSEKHLPCELSQHTAGLQGFNNQWVDEKGLHYIEHAIPNKTWLYLAAGIPTIGLNPGAEASAIYAGKWGTVIDRPKPRNQITLPKIDPRVRAREVMDRDDAKFARIAATVA